jgi:enamine deaminase RidA (YjgF/YER057c/UK114 family)
MDWRMGKGLEIVNPAGWPKPRGYANAVSGRGRMIFVAGQIGWTPDERWESDDFIGQLRQALKNTIEVLAAAGAAPEHIVRMTWYVTDKQEYLASKAAIGAVWRDLLGRNFPAMALVQVVALVEDRARLGIEPTALIPDAD